MAGTAIRKRKPEKIYFRYIQGQLIPADPWAAQLLKKKGFKEGEVVGALIRKLRSYRFNNLVHKIGALCAENLDEFKYTDAHGVVKRLQLEGNIACEEVDVKIDGEWMLYRYPRSISFDSMDEGEYRDVARAICALICEKYWPDMEPDEVAAMAELMPMAA